MISCLFQGEGWRDRAKLTKRWLQTAVKNSGTCRTGGGGESRAVFLCLVFWCIARRDLLRFIFSLDRHSSLSMALDMFTLHLRHVTDWINILVFQKCKLVFLVAVSQSPVLPPPPPPPQRERENWEDHLNHTLNCWALRILAEFILPTLILTCNKLPSVSWSLQWVGPTLLLGSCSGLGLQRVTWFLQGVGHFTPKTVWSYKELI